ncbi:MAG: hypothetical protein ACK4P2_02420 [Hyphomonas sp.]
MKWRVALLSVFGLGACNSGDDALDPASHAGCFDRVSERIGVELAEIDATVGPVEDMRWLIEIEIADNTANVTIVPSSPYLRGGGGRYTFDCDDVSGGELILVEGFR